MRRSAALPPSSRPFAPPLITMKRQPRIRIALALIAGAFTAGARAACFQPDGTLVAGMQTYQPCSNDSTSALSNICCAIDRDIPHGGDVSKGGLAADTCLPNGLCQNTAVVDSEGTKNTTQAAACWPASAT